MQCTPLKEHVERLSTVGNAMELPLMRVIAWGILALIASLVNTMALSAQSLEATKWNEELKSVDVDWQKGDYEKAVQRLDTLISQLDAVAKRMSADSRAELEKMHRAIEKAHQRMSLEGASLQTLPTVEQLVPLLRTGGKKTDQRSMPEAAPSHVSFARDVAPLLIENCSGCHIASRRPGGNYRMDDFQQLVQGGLSGEAVQSRNSVASLIVKKLKGEDGQRMPAGGRPALAKEKIDLIAKWIDQGAWFDGKSPTASIGQVASQAWSENATSDDLAQKRRSDAIQKWKVATSDRPFQEAREDEVLLLSDLDSSGMQQLMKDTQEAIKVVRKQLRIPDKSPVIKGGVVLFAMARRYDYGEFGKMAESRTLPQDWLGHWRKQVVDAYVVVHYDSNAEKSVYRNLMIQLLSSLHVGAFDGVPTWFAEGVGRSVLSQAGGKDARMKQWESQFPHVIKQIKNLDQILKAELGEEELGVFGYGLARKISDRNGRKAFDAFMKVLREGKTFDEAFTMVYAPPELYIRNWLGLPAPKR